MAADGEWSPPAWLWGLYQPGVWLPCEAQLTGLSTLTFWNASAYPSLQSPDDFTSGAAPLWTFIFSANGTLTYVATWFLGKVAINAALEPSSPCLKFSMFTEGASGLIDPAHELNSNAIANEVVQEDAYLNQNPDPLGNPSTLPVPPSPGVALYFPGHELLPSEIAGSGLWTAAYTTCGLVQSYGTITTVTGLLLNATTVSSSHSYAWFSSTGDCYNSVYFVGFNRTAFSNVPPGPGQYLQWKTNVSFLTSAVPSSWNLAQLTTTQFGLVLNSNNLPDTGALCGPGSHNLSSCPTPSAGWYGVLLSPNGTWLDSYPATANGTSWTVPGVAVQTGDLIAFVGSGGYGPSDELELSSGNEPFVYGGDYLEGL